MTQKQLESFFKYLKKDNLLAGPLRVGGVLNFKEVSDIDEIELTNEIPLHSFKKFLLPVREILEDEGKKSPFIPPYKRGDIMNMALIGLTVPDLKAVTILNQVFEKDPFYQDRMKNTLIIGYGEFPCEYRGIFSEQYEENILEHIQFDIFIVKETSSNLSLVRRGNNFRGGYKVFTGSEDGQKALDEFGFKEYENIQYSGHIREEGVDKMMIDMKKAMENSSPKDKNFQDLEKRCLECGRCSIICPLCYCFCLKDGIPPLTQHSKRGECFAGQHVNSLEGNCKERTLTSCFYSEFSEIAGGHKFLKTPAERIYNWYDHKFVRFPEEFSVAGCVNCGRCAKVCPVGINIREVVGKIAGS